MVSNLHGSTKQYLRSQAAFIVGFESPVLGFGLETVGGGWSREGKERGYKRISVLFITNKH